MELETDKAVVEVPAEVSGKVKEILVKEGEKIKVGQVELTQRFPGRIDWICVAGPREVRIFHGYELR